LNKRQYESKEYLEILYELIGITKSNPELLSAVGLCNFDAQHTEEICKYLIDKTGEVGIVSNQVQVGQPTTAYTAFVNQGSFRPLIHDR
jgi:diketogulonate reductase-like aldo/keto reductase